MLRAHPNVIDLAEWRRRRESRMAHQSDDGAVRITLCVPPGMTFIGLRSAEPECPAPDGGTQRIIHRHLSQSGMDDIARRRARRKHQGWRWWLGWLWPVLRLAKRSRPS